MAARKPHWIEGYGFGLGVVAVTAAVVFGLLKDFGSAASPVFAFIGPPWVIIMTAGSIACYCDYRDAWREWRAYAEVEAMRPLPNALAEEIDRL